jgi:cytochrome c553
VKSLLAILAAALLLVGCCSNDEKETKKPAQEKSEAPKPEAPKAAPAATPAAAVETPAEPEPAAAAAPVAAAPVINGAMLFKTKCASCHGQKAEKVALKKSQVIAGWDAAKLSEALHGYKSGTYGGDMKGMMQGQVRALSDEEIDALSNYISGL